MEPLILNHEPLIRLSAFGLVLAAMVAWELLAPRRALSLGRGRRWPANLGIVVLNTGLLRFALPILPVALALLAAERGWGVLNMVELPAALAFLIAVLVLDLAIYLQHVMVHAVPLLWRLHRMHHADQDFDVTTGARFHPIEILFSAGVKLAVILALGPPAVAVIVFEVLLNATAMFNHGNVRLPGAVDRVVRVLVVTPDMHRVHHSVHPAETNSNFGFCFPWWDRLLGTYRPQPRDGHEGMMIGLNLFRSENDQTLPAMLAQPFRGPTNDYAINREPER